ncbi:MAG: UDP-N-acetylmuramoyl-tripeptide--D-alanyl-D-alanine ligase [bacterium]
MTFILVLLTLSWFIRTTKAVLFWLFLWQLKEYHIGRFLDHFRTEKGKRLFINWTFFFKIFLFFYFFFWSFLQFIFPQGIEPGKLDIFFDALLIIFLPLLLVWIALYVLESLKSIRDFLSGKLIKPIWTQKTVGLVSIALALEISLVLAMAMLWDWDFRSFLIFDVLTPVIVSAIVLFFQPLAVLGRNQIINRAKRKREEFPNLLVVGITGSFGKTSTKEFLAAILSEKFRVLKTKEHQNSEVGISQCILNDLKEEHQIFICEMGAYNIGGIKLLCDIAKPKIGILTGINEQHMATFGSQENIIKAKYELIESLPENGAAFFNANNRYCRELFEKTKIRKFFYGEEAKFPGEENLFGAIAVARELGMTDEEIAEFCQKIENKFAGIKIKKAVLKNNGNPISINVIDATYSANPDGVMAHLEYLKTLRQAQGKIVIVMPCLIELGKASAEVHRRIGKKIAEVCDLAIITTKDRLKELREGAASAKAAASQGPIDRDIEARPRYLEILFMESPKEIFDKIKNFCREGDIVLLESRVPKQLVSFLAD